MNTKKPLNSYDETKKMLNTIRNLQETVRSKKVLDEQFERDRNPEIEAYKQSFERDDQGFNQSPQAPDSSQSGEGSDYAVINDVEVVIHSEDPEDLQLNDDEKGKISQLIDDCRAEVAETVEFGKMDIYETSAKLTGQIGEYGLQFTLSTGDDTGLYVNGQMLKIDENSLEVINRLSAFQLKYSSTINDLLVRRKTT